jgi:hypothetical protein
MSRPKTSSNVVYISRVKNPDVPTINAAGYLRISDSLQVHTPLYIGTNTSLENLCGIKKSVQNFSKVISFIRGKK